MGIPTVVLPVKPGGGGPPSLVPPGKKKHSVLPVLTAERQRIQGITVRVWIFMQKLAQTGSKLGRKNWPNFGPKIRPNRGLNFKTEPPNPKANRNPNPIPIATSISNPQEAPRRQSLGRSPGRPKENSSPGPKV